MKKLMKLLVSGIIASGVLLNTFTVFAESERDSKWVYDKKGYTIDTISGSPYLRNELNFGNVGVEVFDADGNSLGKVDLKRKDIYAGAKHLLLDFEEDKTTELVTQQTTVEPTTESTTQAITENNNNSILINNNSNTQVQNDRVIKVSIGSNIANVNGSNVKMDTIPYIQQKTNSTMIPLRFVATALGIDENNIKFNSTTKDITVIKGNDIVEFKVNSSQYRKNGEYSFDVTRYGMIAPVVEVKDGRTFVPFRTLGEAFDLTVEWDNFTRTAIMKSKEVNSNVNQDNNTNNENNSSNEELTEQEIRALEEEVVKLVNEERAKYGLQPLQIDETLMKGARLKSEDMFNNTYFSHTSPTYGSPTDMLKNIFNYKFNGYYTGAGENIASMGSSSKGVVNGWLNSSGHRENILNPNYKYIGVGFYGSKWTQLFTG